MLAADINECVEGTDGCAQLCFNTEGSFQCGCNSGFSLGSDGRSCVGKLRFLISYKLIILTQFSILRILRIGIITLCCLVEQN